VFGWNSSWRLARTINFNLTVHRLCKALLQRLLRSKESQREAIQKL
jgi:hypothetical protein